MITLLLLIIAGIFLGEQDTIHHRPRAAWFGGWWIQNNWYYKNSVVQWIMRYPLSFAKDGWHLCKNIALSSLCLAIAINLQILGSVWLSFLVYYSIIGLSFNFSYHNWGWR